MFIWQDDSQETLRTKIRKEAEAKHNGPTTVGKLTYHLKVVVQKFDIADIVRFEPSRSKGVKMFLGDNLLQRLITVERHSEFISEVHKATEYCGFVINSVGEFFDIFPA